MTKIILFKNKKNIVIIKEHIDNKQKNKHFNLFKKLTFIDTQFDDLTKIIQN